MPDTILTPDQRLRVFVSSTMRELAAERNAVREAVEALRLTPVLFELGARPHPPRELYAAYLKQSQVFVGVYGEEYGWVAPGLDRSGIEDEYLLGRELPRLIYVREPVERRDERLTALLERIRSESAVSYRPFKDAEELRDVVAEDLALLVSERFNAGVGRAMMLRSAPLPVPIGPLIGREREVAAVGELFSGKRTRLVTLVGPGGVGKSRLAFEVARVGGHEFPDGTVPVLLGPLRDAGVVPSTIASALGLAEDPRRPALDVVENALRDRSLLLVLDNFEHLLDAAPLVAHLLERCPAVTALATSRRRLEVRGEYVFRVAPLELPEAAEGTLGVRNSAAVRMFEERAVAASPGFCIDADNAEAVAGICRRLDGLPLAVELAASRIRLFSPSALLDDLSNGLTALDRGARDASERHRTLEAAIRWSYDLLDSTEQQCFCRLGVFSGGSTPEAAAAIADADLVTLEALVEQSLVTSQQTEFGPRLSMLETVREEASHLLERSGERGAVHARHWSYFADVAEALCDGPAEDRQGAVDRMRPDLDNFRAALERAIAAKDPDAVRLAGSLGLFWSNVGLMGEGRRSIERALAASPNAPSRWRARALLMSAWLASDQGDYRDAEPAAARSLELARRTGDHLGTGLALRILGNAALSQGDSDRALALLEESVAELRAAGDETARIRALGTLARCLSSRGELERAAGLYEEVREYDRRHGHSDHLAAMLVHLGIDQRAQGRIPEALQSFTEGASLFRSLGMSHNLAWALVEIARVHAVAGDRRLLVDVLRECVEIFVAVDDRHGFALSLELGAALSLLVESYKTGARLLGAADRLRDETGAALVGTEADDVARDTEALRDALDDDDFAAAWSEGRALAEHDAIGQLKRLLEEEPRDQHVFRRTAVQPNR